MKKFRKIYKKITPVMPLQIALVFSAFVIAMGCFLGYGMDAQMMGVFCCLSAALMAIEFWYRKEKRND